MEELDYANLKIPNQISIMNPYRDSEEIRQINRLFYDKYYGDDAKRWTIIGINPGRLGAGATGIPFTDTKRLEKYCDINAGEKNTHEPSSVFIYDMINAFSNPLDFYKFFYITSAFPLGFTKTNELGKEVNYNYYDEKPLQEVIAPHITTHLKTQISFGLHTDIAYCLGTGKNYKFLNELNKKEKLFDQLIPLEHPRYIMQYKLKQKDHYIQDYILRLTKAIESNK